MQRARRRFQATFVPALLVLALCARAGALDALDALDAEVQGISPVGRLEELVAESWRWRVLERAGLAGSFVAAHPLGRERLIASDRDGLWIYDGRRWTLAPGGALLAGARLTFAVEREGGLLVTTEDAVYGIPADTDAKTAEELDLLHGDRPPEPLTVPVALDDGTLLLGIGASIRTLALPDLADAQLVPDGCKMVYGLGVDRRGVLWSATHQGIYRHVDGEWTKAPVDDPQLDETEMVRVVSGGGLVYMLPRIFDIRQRGFVWDGEDLVALPRLPASGLLTAALVTSGGQLLAAVRRGDLYLLRGGEWIELERPSPWDEPITTLSLLDNERLVLTTNSGRLLVCDLASTRWQVHDPADRVGVSSIINTLAFAQRGGLWVGTHEGVARWDGQRFVDAHLVADELGIRLASITTMAEDERGHLWVGSGGHFQGALRFDGQRWHHHVEMGPGRIHAIRKAPDGELWMLMIPEHTEEWIGGALVRRHADGSWSRIDGNRTYDIVWPPDGPPVVGRIQELAVLLDGDLVPIPGPPLQGVNSAFALHAGPAGDLWVGQGPKARGVFRRPAGSAEWSRVSSEPVGDVAAAAFARTADGFLWFASEDGLFRVDGDVAVRVLDGIRGSPGFWPLLADPGGGLWIGSLGAGLVRYRPDDDTPPRTRFVVTAFPNPEGGGTVFARWQGVDAWNVTPADHMRYRLKLDDGPWSQPTGEAWKSYPDLAPGDHTLAVRSLDGAGNLEAEGDVETFHVVAPAPAWESFAVRLSALLLALTATALIVVLVRQHKERRHAERARAEMGERMRQLAARVMSSQEGERRRLSKDLYDELAQVITAASMNLELARRTPDAPRRQEALEHAQGSLEQALRWARSEAQRIRPTLLDDLGLQAAVQSTLSDFENETDVSVTSHLQLDPELTVGAAASDHLYRILEECLTNVRRHARAERVEVALRGRAGTAELRVADDGEGFDPQAHPAGFGLLDMAERAESAGGVFRLTSSRKSGTIVQVVIPTNAGENPRDQPC